MNYDKLPDSVKVQGETLSMRIYSEHIFIKIIQERFYAIKAIEDYSKKI